MCVVLFDMDKDVEDEKPPLRLAFSNTDRIRFRIPIRSALGRNPACVMMDGEEDDDDGDDDDVVVRLEVDDVDRVKSLLTNKLVDEVVEEVVVVKVALDNAPTVKALVNNTTDSKRPRTIIVATVHNNTTRTIEGTDRSDQESL